MNFSVPKKYTATLLEKKQATQNTLLLTFTLSDQLLFLPGQFVIMYFTHPNGIIVKRSYSIASDNKDTSHIEFCVTLKEQGVASTTFSTLTIGETMQLEGPYGRFCIPDEQDDIVLIAAGSGIAPFRSMLHSLARQEKKVTLIYGFRSENDYLYRDEFVTLAQQKNITIIPTASKPTPAWKGDVGRVNITLQKYLAPANQHIYICGATAMVNDTLSALEKIGFSKEQIKFEGWG